MNLDVSTDSAMTYTSKKINDKIADKAKNPLMMAEAMAVATRAGRLAFLAGRMEKMSNARPSSPIEGKID